MIKLMILSSLVLVICITSSKILYKFGIPILLIFIGLGMLVGDDGIGGIYFDNYELTQRVCSCALLFIMFYGGFGTNSRIAKPVLIPSLLMATIGVIITAAFIGMLCYFIMEISFLESLLIGSVVSSTDAASVFTILRSQRLNLKDELASLLEVESGSNDPIAYMLTIVILTLMSNGGYEIIIILLLKQIVFGISVGTILAKITVIILKKAEFEIDGFYPVFTAAIAILAYSLSELLGGNGYLSVYIAGIVVGNSKIPHKRSLVHFFDSISWVMQIALFFMLGLLASPSQLPSIALTGIVISIFMIVIARPIATVSILSWFKIPIKEQVFVSWVGLRGAASIVFAIYAVTYGVQIDNDIFHIIFFIAIFSVAIQGTLIPRIARKLDLLDNSKPVLKTFNDYKEEKSTKLMEIRVDINSKWINKSIIDADIPEEILIVMIKRKEEVIVPKGSTIILEGDILVLSGNELEVLLQSK